ncbi:MAG: hypothetical protein KDD63_18110 [Bacteroidetes bacterium]|nr:hypothetical protein [Bacteroidota bacterium]MCB0841666.1 hypothetical protein [Bacteroidota bacterium]MCB0854149.1 hypothetical protein [Bacteroidota bacterium]
MKTFIYLFVGLFALTACKQTDNPPSWDNLANDGTIAIKRADKNWRNVSLTSTTSPIGGYLNISVQKLEGRERHKLNLQFIPKEIGTHPICLDNKINEEDPLTITHIMAYYSSSFPDDVWIGRYTCIETEKNYFTVSDYDADTGTISGSFKVHLKATYQSPTQKTEEFITFESEKFVVQVQD